jgi:hypothetical protein
MLRRNIHAGMQVTGACVPVELVGDPELHEALGALGVPLLGDIDSIRDTGSQSGADAVVVTSSAEIGSDKLCWISWQLERTDAHLIAAPGLVEVTGARLHIHLVAGLPLLHVEEPQFEGFRRVRKRTIDRLVAAVALTSLSPLLLIVAATVRLISETDGVLF